MAAFDYNFAREHAFYRGVIPFVKTLFGGAKQDATLFVGRTSEEGVCCVLDDRLDGML